MHKQKTFTLIEMLIVVVIIGILAAALIPRLQSVQARARDTKRKADLHQIATALEIYKEDNGGSYNNLTIDAPNHSMKGPIGGMVWPISTTNSIKSYYRDDQTDYGDILALLSKYMTTVPSDTDQSTWTNPGADVHGYLVSFMNRHSTLSYSQFNSNAFVSNAFVLAARTESDGSSSNRVTNSSLGYVNTGDDQGFWGGSIGPVDGNCPDNFCTVTADLYDTYMCHTVTFSGETNDISGTCYANKDSTNPGGDLRYIYVD